MSSPSNEGIQVPALGGDVKIDIASHEQPMLTGWCPNLIQAIIQHL